MLSLYHFSYGADKFHTYSVDKWKFFDVGEATASEYNLPRKSIHPSLGRFVRALIDNMATYGFANRDLYYEELQSGLRELIATMFGANPKIAEIDTSIIIDIIFEYSFIKNLILELENDQNVEFATDVQLLLLQIFAANEDTFEDVQDLYFDNIDFFAYFPNTFIFRKDILAQLIYRDNVMGLMIGHQPELSYCFLSSCDSRFLGEDKCKFNDGTYYLLHVDKPTTLSIYEKNLDKVIFEYKDNQLISDILAAEQYADGSIDIYLPKNGNYDYQINAEGASLINVDPLMGESVINDSLPLSGNI